jgi:hypothetical protein
MNTDFTDLLSVKIWRSLWLPESVYRKDLSVGRFVAKNLGVGQATFLLGA